MAVDTTTSQEHPDQPRGESYVIKTLVDLGATTLFAVLLAPVLIYSAALTGNNLNFITAAIIVYVTGLAISILNQIDARR